MIQPSEPRARAKAKERKRATGDYTTHDAIRDLRSAIAYTPQTPAHIHAHARAQPRAASLYILLSLLSALLAPPWLIYTSCSDSWCAPPRVGVVRIYTSEKRERRHSRFSSPLLYVARRSREIKLAGWLGKGGERFSLSSRFFFFSPSRLVMCRGLVAERFMIGIFGGARYTRAASLASFMAKWRNESRRERERP